MIGIASAESAHKKEGYRKVIGTKLLKIVALESLELYGVWNEGLGGWRRRVC